MMMIGSSVDYVRSGGTRKVPVTKAVEHLYATSAKFSGRVRLAFCPTYSYPPRRHVYAAPPPTLQDLQRRITDACANVTPAMLHRVQREVQAKAQMCIVADGEKFEHGNMEQVSCDN
ncbi:hypothetical protein AVEN_221780-1 [Araneus ventricosus]|uniref:Uncharacterized protein n=1 Tax=Araneus ventricosus TaxID=182803 RepID=A0A4Y2W915_ARAVE|nr:hypothetical protein AVEN_161889-1 [Araneus ventricosus]GBO33391.1 hypothetical protein AVEN_221780-1 [Araneus ventricosus]